MSKAISTEAIFTRFSSRVDGSMSFGGCTPELTSDEKVALMALHGCNVKLLIQPMDGAPDEIVLVKSDIEHKTPSERLRATLFCLYRQLGFPGNDFDRWYKSEIETLINAVKAKLEKRTF